MQKEQTFKASKSNVLENSKLCEGYLKQVIGTRKVLFLIITPALIVLRIRVFHMTSGGLTNLCPEKVTHNA